MPKKSKTCSIKQRLWNTPKQAHNFLVLIDIEMLYSQIAPHIPPSKSMADNHRSQTNTVFNPKKPISKKNQFITSQMITTKKELEVVRGLDLQRYMGRWYEIASFPFSFQPKNGINSRATYTLKEDGTVHCLNETWLDGKRSSIQGSAYKADPKSDEAELKVKFYVPPFLPIIPVVGDYCTLMLDEDYQYALIGQPSRKYLWILSREPELDEEIYHRLLEKATEQGYDIKRIKKTTQTEPPPEEEGPKDTKGIWWIKAILGK